MNTSGMGRQLALVSLFPARKPRTLDQALTHAARQWLGNECVVTEQLSYRYRQIDKWLTSLAAGLITNGIKLGDRVALVMANYAAFVAIEFAIFSVGTIVAPKNFLNLRNEDADTDSLRQQMVNQRIRHPEKLERLYTVAPVPREMDL